MAITISPSTPANREAVFKLTNGYVLASGAAAPVRTQSGFQRDANNAVVVTDVPAAPVMDKGFRRDGVGGPLVVSTNAIARIRHGFAVDSGEALVFASLV